MELRVIPLADLQSVFIRFSLTVTKWSKKELVTTPMKTVLIEVQLAAPPPQPR